MRASIEVNWEKTSTLWPASRSWSTMRAMWTVFQTSTALESRLKQLALFNAVLVGRVSVERERPVVVAKIARVEAGEQTVALDREALAIGGGATTVAPDAAQLQAMMVIDQDGVGRLERGLAQEPPAGVLQRRCSEAVDALAHGGEAEVGAVRDQGGEQRPGQIGVARLIPVERLEGAGEAAPFVYVLQQILDAYAG